MCLCMHACVAGSVHGTWGPPVGRVPEEAQVSAGHAHGERARGEKRCPCRCQGWQVMRWQVMPTRVDVLRVGSGGGGFGGERKQNWVHCGACRGCMLGHMPGSAPCTYTYLSCSGTSPSCPTPVPWQAQHAAAASPCAPGASSGPGGSPVQTAAAHERGSGQSSGPVGHHRASALPPALRVHPQGHPSLYCAVSILGNHKDTMRHMPTRHVYHARVAAGPPALPKRTPGPHRPRSGPGHTWKNLK